MHRLVILEDEVLISLSLKSMMEELGYEIMEIFNNAHSLYSFLENDDIPDFALVDIVLEDQYEGIDAASYMRKEYNIPSIFITAYADQDILSRAKHSLPMGYIQKPFTIDSLRIALEIGIHKEIIHRKLNETINILQNIYKVSEIHTFSWNILNNTVEISTPIENFFEKRGVQFEKDNFLQALSQALKIPSVEEFLDEVNTSLHKEQEYIGDFTISEMEKYRVYIKISRSKHDHPETLIGIITST